MKQMLITKVNIKKNCRKTHGQNNTFKIAMKYLKEKYDFTLTAPINQRKTIRIDMYIVNE